MTRFRRELLFLAALLILAPATLAGRKLWQRIHVKTPAAVHVQATDSAKPAKDGADAGKSSLPDYFFPFTPRGGDKRLRGAVDPSGPIDIGSQSDEMASALNPPGAAPQNPPKATLRASPPATSARSVQKAEGAAAIVPGSSQAKAALIYQIGNSSTPDKVSFGETSWIWSADAPDGSGLFMTAQVRFREPGVTLMLRLHTARPPYAANDLFIDAGLQQAPPGYALLGPLVLRNRGQADSNILTAAVPSQSRGGGFPGGGAYAPFMLPLSLDSDTNSIKANIALLRDKRWIDLPVKVAANQQAIVSIEKPDDVGKVLATALTARVSSAADTTIGSLPKDLRP